MFDCPMDKMAGRALANASGIEELARENIRLILAMFKEDIPGACPYISKSSVVDNLEKIKQLADGALIALAAYPEDDMDPDHYPPDPPENIAAECREFDGWSW